jgi:hypothetical protein
MSKQLSQLENFEIATENWTLKEILKKALPPFFSPFKRNRLPNFRVQSFEIDTSVSRIFSILNLENGRESRFSEKRLPFLKNLRINSQFWDFF